MKQAKLFFTCGIIGLLSFSILSLVLHFGDWLRMAIVGCLGLFLGFLVVPEIEPKLIKNGPLVQGFCGAIAGVFVSLIVNLSGGNVVISIVIGGIVGWFARYWLKYVPVP